MIYYKLFDLFPVLTIKDPDLDEMINSEFKKNITIPKNVKAGGAIFFPKSAGIKPSITAEDYRRIFKNLDQNMLEDLENYDIYLIDHSVREKDIKKIIEKVLLERGN